MRIIKMIVCASLGLMLSHCTKEKENIVEKTETIPAPQGAVMLTGRGKPSPSLGKIGDFYIDLTQSDLYGAKTQAGWGNPISLKGADGQNGTNGQNKHIYGPKTATGWGNPVIQF